MRKTIENKKKKILPIKNNSLENSISIPNKPKVNMADIGNATLGSLIADGIKSLLTKNDNKPLTKKDLQEILEGANFRYHLVTNLPARFDGAYPYYDIDTQALVYLFPY